MYNKFKIMKSLSFPTRILSLLVILSVTIHFIINKELKSTFFIIIASIFFIYNQECLITGKCYTMVWYQIALYAVSVFGYIYYHYITGEQKKIPDRHQNLMLPKKSFF